MGIAENVRWRRTALGMTQGELAQKIRVEHRAPDRSYISRLETGRVDPQASVIRSLARALHVKPWYLMADLSDNVEFWDGYMQLTAPQKREIQRSIQWLLERRTL